MERKSQCDLYTQAKSHRLLHNRVFLANELDYLLTVFIQNGYPEKTVWRILYQESKPKGTKEEIDFSKSMYVPYHPRTKRLYRMIKEDFGFSIIYKKNTNSGRHPSKERPHDRETI